MTSSYKSRAEATDDRACLELMREALNAAHNAVRLDECRMWTVRGAVATSRRGALARPGCWPSIQ